MGGCCDPKSYAATFGDGYASQLGRRFRKRGLDPARLRLVDFLTDRGIQGASVLEIGGGVGELHVELLRRGAARATNLEISRGYETEAAHLLAVSGVRDRVSRRFLDIADAPDEVAEADVVLLHRVVCCYPDYERLLSSAATHARRLLVFSHPPRNLVSRAMFGSENLLRRLRHNDFRAFVHPPERMHAVVESRGLSMRYEHHGVWTVVGFERSAA
jgi:magnesium-protoporphyrin O-methyltransferase